MAAVAVRYQDLQHIDVSVISVSMDSAFTHKAWNDRELSEMVDAAWFPRPTREAGATTSLQVVRCRRSGVGTSQRPGKTI